MECSIIVHYVNIKIESHPLIFRLFAKLCDEDDKTFQLITFAHRDKVAVKR